MTHGKCQYLIHLKLGFFVFSVDSAPGLGCQGVTSSVFPKNFSAVKGKESIHWAILSGHVNSNLTLETALPQHFSLI